MAAASAGRMSWRVMRSLASDVDLRSVDSFGVHRKWYGFIVGLSRIGAGGVSIGAGGWGQIPAFAGMTGRAVGMTWVGAGMTGRVVGMT